MKKEKAIWLFAGGPMQESAAKKILDFGYKLILADLNRDCVCAKYAHEFVECDTFDIDGNKAAAEKLRQKYTISAGVTLAADCHETVAHVNRQLGLPGISPEISHICRHKNLTRAVLTDAGIPQPQFACVQNIEEARSFLEILGGRCVIKATDNSGSRGFAKINSPVELTDDVFATAISAGTSGSVIIEEALNPREDCISELSVETLWFNGKMYWLNWVDRLFRSDLKFFPSLHGLQIDPVSWGVEIGHINPACHSVSIRNQIHEMVHAAGLALGMKEESGGHILKADVMLTNHGPIIIELTPRLSGGWDSSATTPARGADFQGGIIRLALGEQLDLDLWYSFFEFKNPSLYASIMADISPGAKDCIGRKFALGIDFEREKSLQLALNNVKESSYVIPMV
ncbi:MAG: ATP-grasp domain-containing protein [Burkholderiales bacterium]|nr:ATP-grasp domain-containing protein [Burkholderiales bacterium]